VKWIPVLEVKVGRVNTETRLAVSSTTYLVNCNTARLFAVRKQNGTNIQENKLIFPSHLIYLAKQLIK